MGCNREVGGRVGEGTLPHDSKLPGCTEMGSTREVGGRVGEGTLLNGRASEGAV